jgi:site-specific DNA recombinase
MKIEWLKRALIYLRVSTTQQAQRDGDPEGYSIPFQRDACQRRAEALEAEVLEEFVDLGESGTTADRPGLQRLLERVRAGDIDYVIVHKVDRLARNLADNAAISVALEAAGVQLVSVSENIDKTPSGKLMHGIMASIAEFYSRNLANEIMKGSVQKAKEGGTPFMAPIGYLNVRDFSDGKDVRSIDVDPERAPLVKIAFQLYGSGLYSLKELLYELTRQGLTNRPTAKRPARPLRVGQLADMLRNKYYIGKVVFRGVENDGKHEPLIDQELFDKVQNVLRVHNVAGTRHKVHKHYLKGTLYCHRCGSRMGFSFANGNGGIYPYFYCLGRHRGEGCTLPYLNADDVENQVAEHYALVEIALKLIPEIREKLRTELDANHQQRTSLVKRSHARLARLSRERDKLLHAYYADMIDDDQFKPEQDRITREIKDVTNALAEQDVRFAEVEGIITEALEMAANCQRGYREADEELRQKFNQLFFKKLRIDSDGIGRTDLSDEMSILIGEDIAPVFELEKKELVLASVGAPSNRDGRDRDVLFSGVGSSKTALVEVRGFEPLTSAVRRQRSTGLSYTPWGQLA